MKSFFTRIQSKFSASYGGRYVETILKEISINEEHLVKRLFPNIKEAGYLETEYHFSINNIDRIADIVLISEETGKPLAFVEIKYDDHNNEKNSAQLEDYIKLCKKKNTEFLYLTQYYPSFSDLEFVKKNGHTHILFSDLAEKLRKQNGGVSQRAIMTPFIGNQRRKLTPLVYNFHEIFHGGQEDVDSGNDSENSAVLFCREAGNKADKQGPENIQKHRS